MNPKLWSGCGGLLTMLVKFASVCDRCGRRGAEYSNLPLCYDCFEHVCAECDPEFESDLGPIYCSRCQEN
jgi:hypothetical protein